MRTKATASSVWPDNRRSPSASSFGRSDASTTPRKGAAIWLPRRRLHAGFWGPLPDRGVRPR